MSTPKTRFRLAGLTTILMLVPLTLLAAGELVLTTGLNSTMARAIGKEILPVRKTLADYTIIEATAATEVILASTTIQDGRVAMPFRSRSFKLKAGVNRIPGEDYIPGSQLIPGEQFVAGDSFVPGAHTISADQFTQTAQSIASSGAIGRARVDWKTQSVLLLAVIPADAKTASAAQVRTIAFIMGTKFMMPERFD